MKRRIGLLLSMVGVFMLLAGCSSVKEPITADSPHFWDKYVVYPLSELITYVAKLTGDNYGLSIILVTILIRLLILPLMIKQLRSVDSREPFEVIGKIIPRYENENWTFTELLYEAPYLKSYQDEEDEEDEEADCLEYIDNTDKIIYLLYRRYCRM